MQADKKAFFRLTILQDSTGTMFLNLTATVSGKGELLRIDNPKTVLRRDPEDHIPKLRDSSRMSETLRNFNLLADRLLERTRKQSTDGQNLSVWF